MDFSASPSYICTRARTEKEKGKKGKNTSGVEFGSMNSSKVCNYPNGLGFKIPIWV